MNKEKFEYSGINICYLCGKPLYDKKGFKELSKTTDEIFFHHDHCNILYNRFRSVYGSNISDLGFDKVKWGAYTGDLIEFLLIELRKALSSKSKSLQIKDFEDESVKLIRDAKKEVVILVSSIEMYNLYVNLLKSIFVLIETGWVNKPVFRFLVSREIYDSYLSIENTNDGSIQVETFDSNANICMFLMIDRKVTVFSTTFDNKTQNNSSLFNIISKMDSLIWYGSIIFESLWKQSLLEKKVNNLSKITDSEDLSQNNVMRMIAHELKSPIQPILGFSDLIQSNSQMDSKQKDEILKIISRNVRKLDLLTTNILDYARMENNTFQLNYESFDIIKTIKEIRNDYGLSTKHKKIDMDFIFPSDSIIIKADKLRITEVLDNVIGNAIKFTSKGNIDIILTKQKDLLKIEISDTGYGIGQKDFPYIFDKFYTTDKLGTGLGLYISKKIIEKHGGRIYAANNYEKKGCTFFIELPVIH